MNDAYKSIKQGLEDALAHAKGKDVGARPTVGGPGAKCGRDPRPHRTLTSGVCPEYWCSGRNLTRLGARTAQARRSGKGIAGPD